MNYGVGDTVVCIDASDCGLYAALVLGKTYKVLHIHHCTMTFVTVNDGVPAPPDVHCGLCKSKDHGDYSPWRFIKLDCVKQEQEEEATA